MRALHEAGNVVVEALQKCELRRSVRNTREPVEWRCVILVVPYCDNILEAEELSTVLHGVAAKRPSVRCMVTREDIIRGKIAGERTVKERKMIISRVIELPRKNAGSVGNGNEVGHDEKGECGQ